MSASKSANDPYNRSASCLPCQYGDHEGCRHRMDGLRYSGKQPDGTCRCENDGHPAAIGCRVSVYVSTGSNWGESHQCDRQVKGTIPDRSIDNTGRTYEQPACGPHIAGRKRSDTNTARWRSEQAERNAAYEREYENRRSAEDYVAKLADLGIKTDVAEVHGKHTGAVAVQGETLLGLVTELHDLRREMGIDQ